VDPVPKIVIPTRLATRKGQLEAGTADEIDELITALNVAKAGLAGAAAAIAAARGAEAGRQGDAASGAPDEPVPCWCGHAARVHNVVANGDGRGFCTECHAGRCGRYEAAKVIRAAGPEILRRDRERYHGMVPGLAGYLRFCALAPGHADGCRNADGSPIVTGPAPEAEPASAAVAGWKLSGAGRWTAVRPDGLELVVERLDDGMSFLPRAGAAVGPVFDGLPAAATWATEFAPGPVITDPGNCPSVNPESGAPCVRTGTHTFHRDRGGKVSWVTGAAAADGPRWCGYRAGDGRGCTRPEHPADEPHAADGIVLEAEPERPWQDDMTGRPPLELVAPLRPDHEVIPAALVPCNEAHPSLGTLCTGMYPHPMPHVGPAGETWVTEFAAAVTS
jgi:hypothetical protein